MSSQHADFSSPDADGFDLETRSKTSYVIRSPASSRSPAPHLPSLGLMPVRGRDDIQPVPKVPNTWRRGNMLTSFYFSMSGVLGFREKYSLSLFVVFGGALIGYCLARSLLMDSKKRLDLTVAGEMFWFMQAPYKVGYIIHIFLSIIGGIFVGAQFIPAIRRHFVLLHRINGYFCIITLVIANIAGAIVTRRSFGGELNVQSAYWILAIMSTYSLVTGAYYAKKETREHRKWMLRAVVYFSVVITGKLIMLAASSIITMIGLYYSTWQCDEVLYTLNDLQKLSQLYPECMMAGSTLTNPSTAVAVHCSIHEGSLGTSSCYRATHGMGLWIATIIHIIGVEIYLRNTARSNYQKISYALEPFSDQHHRDGSVAFQEHS